MVARRSKRTKVPARGKPAVAPKKTLAPRKPAAANKARVRRAEKTTAPTRYPFVAVDVPEAEAEEAGVRLFDLGALGVEHRDETTLQRGSAGRVTLVASFGRKVDATRALAQLPRSWIGRVDEVVGDAWRDEWKKHFEPFHLTDRLVIRPPWHAYKSRRGEQIVVLEPGRAFGTGLHETTSLVAQILSEREPEVSGKAVLDVGCGSGILGLAALTIGAKRVRAIDNDVEAVAVTRENAKRNGRSSQVVSDATPVQEISDRFGLVVANIDAPTLVDLAPFILARAMPGALIVLSGILAPSVDASQWERVRIAFGDPVVLEVKKKGEWFAAVIRA